MNVVQNWHGLVIAEGLKDPQLVNALRMWGGAISDEGLPSSA